MPEILTPAVDPTLLRIENLTKVFELPHGFFRRAREVVHAVRGVSLEIARSATLGLVGESGCGKSTLGRCILRLIEPTEGRIFFEQSDLLALSGSDLRQVRRKIQIVFQDPYSSLDPRQKIGDAIMEGLVIHDLLRPSQRKERVIALLQDVGLKSEHYNSYAHEFSGGQRQRVAIARALAVDPTFIVADETVSALDVSIQAQILNLLIELQRKRGLTYLFISHNLHVVRHISDRIAVMYLGRVVEIGDAEAVHDRPSHPYTKALLSAALEPDPSSRISRSVATGDVPSAINPPTGCAFHPRCPLVEEVCRRVDPALAFVGTHGVACHKARIEDMPAAI